MGVDSIAPPGRRPEFAAYSRGIEGIGVLKSDGTPAL